MHLMAIWILIKMFIATLGLHLGFSAKLGIWQVPACKMEPQRGIIMVKPPTQPPTHPAAHLFLTDRMTYRVLILWGCLEGVLDVSQECLGGVLRVSEGCLDSVRKISWQFQKGVLTMSEGCLDSVRRVPRVSLHVFLLQIFGQLMSGRNVFGPKNLLIPNNFELITLNSNLLWIIFFLTKSY